MVFASDTFDEKIQGLIQERHAFAALAMYFKLASEKLISVGSGDADRTVSCAYAAGIDERTALLDKKTLRSCASCCLVGLMSGLLTQSTVH
jgi:hypothetical protein